jgi:hypothetical protein
MGRRKIISTIAVLMMVLIVVVGVDGIGKVTGDKWECIILKGHVAVQLITYYETSDGIMTSAILGVQIIPWDRVLFIRESYEKGEKAEGK